VSAPKLTPATLAQVRRILDREARRLLDEQTAKANGDAAQAEAVRR
jgi:hypothetical protein